MNLVAYMDACGLVILIILGIFIWLKIGRTIFEHVDISTTIVPLYLVMVYVFLSNTLEWFSINTTLDQYEDYAEVLWPLLVGVSLYVFIQRSVYNDVVQSTTALEKAQHLTAGIMNTSPTGIVVVEISGRITFANAYAEHIIGMPQEEITQLTYDKLTHLMLGERITNIPREKLPFYQVIHTQTAMHNTRIAVTGVDGIERELSVSGAPVLNESGELECVVLVLNDVSDLVHAQEEVNHLNAVLRAIQAISQLVARERNPEILLSRVCEVLVEARGYRYAWVLRRDPQFHIVAASEPGWTLPAETFVRALTDNQTFPCVTQLMDAPAQSCIPNIVDCKNCDFQHSHQLGIDQAISVCLVHDEHKYGALFVGITEGFKVDVNEPALIQDAATDLAFALDSIQQEQARLQAEDKLARQIQAQQNFQERLRDLAEITNELALADSTTELCRRTVELGTQYLQFDRIGIWLRSEVDPQVLVGAFGIDEDGQIRDERHIRRQVQDEFTRYAGTQNAVVTKYTDVQLHNCFGEVVGYGMQLAATIWDGYRFIGLFNIDNLFEHRPYDAYDEEILGLYATTLGHLYSRIRAEEQLQIAAEEHQQRAVQQEALNAVIANAVTATDLDVLVRIILNRTLSALNLQSGSVWALEVQSNAGACSGVVQPLLRNVVEAVVSQDDVSVVEDVRDLSIPDALYPEWSGDASTALQAHNIRSFIAVPVTSAMERIGCLVFTNDHPVHWSHEECRLVSAISQQLGSAAERFKLLAEVQNQVSRLQTVMDTVPEGVVLLDQLGEVLLANTRGQSDLEYLADVFVGDRLLELGGYPLSELNKSRPRGRWHEVRKADRTFEVIAKPASSSDGTGGWVMVLRDVTEDRAVAEHQERQERLAALGRLAAGIAHDFNNIMAVVVLYTQMAARQQELLPATRERLKIVSEQTKRATDLIQQILDFSRRSILEMKPMRLDTFLVETCSIIRRTLPDTITLNLTLEEGLHNIKGDATRLQQVLMNLAKNAKQAMVQGGEMDIVVDNVHVPEGEVSLVPMLDQGHWVRMRFSDKGKGIPRDIQPFIFEPFYSTKMRSGGTGLGLAQVHGIVKQHNGEITVDSQEDLGTTFILYFPAIREAEVIVPENQSTEALLSGHGETVLVVEDNNETREALSTALHSLGYNVVRAVNGLEALAYLENNDGIRVVLSDAIMPELGGVGLLRGMQVRGYDTPFIILSGYLAPEARAEMPTPNNLVAWLAKPVDYYSLAEAVAKAVQNTSVE